MRDLPMRDFWNLPPSEQQHTVQAADEHEAHVQAEIAHAQLEIQAMAEGKLVHNGQLVSPADYPCTCEWREPQTCFRYSDRVFSDEEQRDKYCNCPCHTVDW